MEDEIILSGKYKDFEIGEKYSLAGASEKEVVNILEGLRERIELPAYKFSGVDIRGINNLVKINGRGLGAAVSFLESRPPGELRKSLLACCPDKVLYDAAESCFLNSVLKAAGVRYSPPAEKPSSAPEKENIPGQIAFIGCYRNWMAIKKLSVGDAEDWEVSGILSKIHDTIIAKAFQFTGAKADEALVKKFCKGKRKSLGNLVSALKELSENLKGSELDNAYLVKKVFEGLSYLPCPGVGMLVKAHPELKPKKPRGRMPKG